MPSRRSDSDRTRSGRGAGPADLPLAGAGGEQVGAAIDPALAEALAAIGDRWTLMLISVLLEGPRRFGELQERLPGIAPNVLSQRLRHLRDHGLLFAEAYSQRPPRYVYELTATGHELADPLRLLADWALRQGQRELPRHRRCGSALEVAWYCPTCQEPVDPDSDADGEAGEETHFV